MFKSKLVEATTVAALLPLAVTGCTAAEEEEAIPAALYEMGQESFAGNRTVSPQVIGNTACTALSGEYAVNDDRFFVATAIGPFVGESEIIDALYFASTEGPVNVSQNTNGEINYEIAVQDIPGHQVSTVTSCREQSGGAVLSIRESQTAGFINE